MALLTSFAKTRVICPRFVVLQTFSTAAEVVVVVGAVVMM